MPKNKLTTRQFLSSETKWVRNKASAVKGELCMGDIYGKCGFCRAYLDAGEDTCGDCPLFPDYCSDNFAVSGTATFWKIDEAILAREWKQAAVLCDEMLLAIRSHDPRKKRRAKK